MDFEITIDDPKAFTKPFTIKAERVLAADMDLLEDYCENERDRRMMSGDTGVRLKPETAARYAGVYDLGGREFTVTAQDDLIIVRGLGEPKLPLLVQSQTTFMSTATPTGFEFVQRRAGPGHARPRAGRRRGAQGGPQGGRCTAAMTMNGS